MKVIKLHSVLSNVLYPLCGHEPTIGVEVFRSLFLLSFHDLDTAKVGNPLIHHIIVLKHIIEIALNENLNILQAGAIAILHDIAPVPKIRKADLLISNPNMNESQESKRKNHRLKHMQEGSVIARKKLSLINQYFGSPVFSDQDIDSICHLIEIHDNPSIDIPIPRDNWLAVSFREADRLWMLSDEGFAYDMMRDRERLGEIRSEKALALFRLRHVLERFHEERNLYDKHDNFLDDSLFFRTKTGYKIYQRYLGRIKENYNIAISQASWIS